jgi:hypothetical protein
LTDILESLKHSSECKPDYTLKISDSQKYVTSLLTSACTVLIVLPAKQQQYLSGFSTCVALGHSSLFSFPWRRQSQRRSMLALRLVCSVSTAGMGVQRSALGQTDLVHVGPNARSWSTPRLPVFGARVFPSGRSLANERVRLSTSGGGSHGVLGHEG